MKSIQLFVIVLFVFASCSKKQDKLLPEQQNLTESVYASATIQPENLYHAYAIVSGILDDNLVEEGVVVSKNEALFQIINSAPKLNAQNAKYTLQLAQENYNGSAAILGSIEDEIAAATLKYKNDSINFLGKKIFGNKKLVQKLSSTLEN